MNRKWSIGFFAATFLAVAGMSMAYQVNYTQQKQALIKEQKRQEALLEKQTAKKEQAVTTEGSAKKESAYYLTELNGYVAVYLEDKTTIFEYTNILVSSLPAEVQTEIKAGKIIDQTKDLYGFLENYSS